MTMDEMARDRAHPKGRLRDAGPLASARETDKNVLAGLQCPRQTRTHTRVEPDASRGLDSVQWDRLPLDEKLEPSQEGLADHHPQEMTEQVTPRLLVLWAQARAEAGEKHRKETDRPIDEDLAR